MSVTQQPLALDEHFQVASPVVDLCGVNEQVVAGNLLKFFDAFARIRGGCGHVNLRGMPKFWGGSVHPVKGRCAVRMTFRIAVILSLPRSAVYGQIIKPSGAVWGLSGRFPGWGGALRRAILRAAT